VACCFLRSRRDQEGNEPFLHQLVVVKGVAQGIKAGTGLPPGMPLLVPGMLEYRRSEEGPTGQNLSRIGLLGMAQLCEATYGMVQWQAPAKAHTNLLVADLGGRFPPNHRGLPQPGVGTLPLHGKPRLPAECLHQWRGEHQPLGRTCPLQEFPAMISTSGC